MKTKPIKHLLTFSHQLSALCLLTSALGLPAFAQGTAFTYQGRLNDGTGPANGTYQLRFALFDALTVGNQVGSPLTNAPVNVSNGLFTVALDFGANFPGANRWLEIGVRTNGGGAFTSLIPRQPITATPYAITAGNLSGALSGTSLSGTYSSPVTLNNVANNFAGSGANLTALNASQLTSGTVSDARLSANVALRAGGNAFTGNQTIADNLGIGTTTPSQKLQIVGPENSAIDLATGPLTLRSSVNSAAGAAVGTVSSHDLTLFTGNLPRQTITADGKVGLNKNNPATALDVNGTVTATSFSGSGANLTALNASQLGSGTVPAVALSNAWKLGGNTGTAGAVLGTVDSQPIILASGNSRVLSLETKVVVSFQGVVSTAVNVLGGANINTIANGVIGATIGGGGRSDVDGFLTTPRPNTVWDEFGTVGGGLNNTAGSADGNTVNAIAATVAGGEGNQASGSHSFIGGGYLNTIQTNAVYTIIGGGYLNTIQPNATYATLGGGNGNTIQNSAQVATLGGGYANKIQTSASGATLGGGFQNTIQTSANGATLGGGLANTIQTNAAYATLGGGSGNNIQTDAAYATLGGGYFNTIQPNSTYATLNGGNGNTIQNNADFGTVSGGFQNTIQPYATGATIGGGSQNTIQPSGISATIPGGEQNSANAYAFAAGRRAKANHTGAFVWADSTAADFASTADNQFAIRASGGVVLSGSTPNLSFGSTTRQMLNLYGTDYAIGAQFDSLYFRCANFDGNSGFSWYKGGVHNDGYAQPGAGGIELMHLIDGGLWVHGTFINSSDRNVKQDFAAVNSRAVLEKVAQLPIQTWAYKNDPHTKHLGPVAQDFYAAFAVGPDDKHIATVDESGVALAAIQGLNQKVEEQRAENAELKRELSEIKQLVLKLSNKKD